MLPRIIATAVASLALTGCASTVLNYQPPPEHVVKNQVELRDKPDVVWDRIVKGLSQDRFEIKNMEKASRIINLEFNTSVPTNYVDCGVSERIHKTGVRENVYRYDVVGTATYQTVYPGTSTDFIAKRQARMVGRASIYLEPAPSGGTIVTVNGQYDVQGRIEYYTLFEGFYGKDDFRIPLSTKTPYVSKETPPNQSIRCVSKGTLEEKLLSFAQK